MRLLLVLRQAYAGVDIDQNFLQGIAPGLFRRRPAWRALLTNDSIRAAFLMRIAAAGGFSGRVARTLLIGGYSCDVSAGASINAALHLPHPIGIVIGQGVRLDGDVTIFQHVTLGASGAGCYPRIERNVRIFPQAVIVGDVVIGAGARIGAGSFVEVSVPPGIVFKGAP